MTPFGSFLSASLDVLRSEAPGSYRCIYEKLDGRTVAIEVDGERLSITPRWDRLVPCVSTENVAVRASSTRAALVRLLEGELDLTRAILDDDVVLIGALDDLTAFYDGLIAYFMGAIRCPTFPKLLSAFLEDAASRARTSRPRSPRQEIHDGHGTTHR
jgi:hypothetical protein